MFKIVNFFFCDNFDAPKHTRQMWIAHLQRGSDKRRFQYCLNSNGFIHDVRAIQDFICDTIDSG